jgi:hypothetical protein
MNADRYAVGSIEAPLIERRERCLFRGVASQRRPYHEEIYERISPLYRRTSNAPGVFKMIDATKLHRESVPPPDSPPPRENPRRPVHLTRSIHIFLPLFNGIALRLVADVGMVKHPLRHMSCESHQRRVCNLGFRQFRHEENTGDPRRNASGPPARNLRVDIGNAWRPETCQATG